ncbi:MAG: hypothetical protein ABFR53_03320 [Actinomycetota bacterium]
MTAITGLQLPIDWTSFGWTASPGLAGVTLETGDPKWAWTDSAPALSIHIFEPSVGDPVEKMHVDHVVVLVPDLDRAIGRFSRAGLEPRLRMKVRDRPAVFFRAGPVVEVIESPVRQASLYGVALASEIPLETISLEWKSRGLDVGAIRPAIQPGRRIMTIHDLDAGLAVMSLDRAL